jgi:hypothetical protein
VCLPEIGGIDDMTMGLKIEVTACHAAVMLRVLFVQSEGLSALPTSCFDSLQYDNAVEL